MLIKLKDSVEFVVW